jgi:hypothetical protein
LYNILIEFRVPMKLIRLIKMCLNETYSKVHICKHLSDSFPIQNGLRQGDALSPLHFNFALEYDVRKVQKNLVGPFSPKPSVFLSVVRKFKHENIHDYNFACGSVWV